MLESEAREKWCDRALVRDIGTKVSFNRLINSNGEAIIPTGTECIASKCMRWIPQEVWRRKVMDDKSGEMLKVSDGDCAYNLQAYEGGEK